MAERRAYDQGQNKMDPGDIYNPLLFGHAHALTWDDLGYDELISSSLLLSLLQQYVDLGIYNKNQNNCHACAPTGGNCPNVLIGITSSMHNKRVMSCMCFQ